MKRPIRIVLAAFSLLGPMLGSAAADIAASLVRASEGGFDVQIGVTPAPLRVGSSEWSVSVRDIESGRSVPGADLELELRRVTPEASEVSDVSDASDASETSDALMAAHHHHEAAITATFEPQGATARTFQTCRIELGQPGRWSGWLRVSTDAASASIPFDFDVQPARSVILRHWVAFAIVPLGLLLFGVQQWRVRSSRGRA